MNNIKSRFTLILSVLILVATLLAVLAPLLAFLKLNFISDSIYWIFQWFCHQRPWRSYHMFDYQYAMDARMMTLFSSMGIGGLIAIKNKLKPKSVKIAIIFLCLMLLPMAIDGVTQLIAEISIINKVTQLPFYESTNLIRSITGIFAGLGISLTLFPYINNYEIKSSIKDYLKSAFVSFSVSFIAIPIFVLLWNITSQKYLPSSMFFDNVKRFPGYNYEVTTNAGHSTIKRIFTEPTLL